MDKTFSIRDLEKRKRKIVKSHPQKSKKGETKSYLPDYKKLQAEVIAAATDSSSGNPRQEKRKPPWALSSRTPAVSPTRPLSQRRRRRATEFGHFDGRHRARARASGMGRMDKGRNRAQVLHAGPWARRRQAAGRNWDATAFLATKKPPFQRGLL